MDRNATAKKGQIDLFKLKMDSDLELILSLTLITLVFIYTPVLNQSIFRSVVSLGMVFLIPGYSLTAALYPGKDDVGIVERIALSFGLNMIISPLILLGLNYTPWGITQYSIFNSLMAFTILCSLLAGRRRYRLPEDKRFFIDFGRLVVGLRRRDDADKTKLGRAITIIVAVAILLSVASVYYAITTPITRENFTEFYLKMPDGAAKNFPASLAVGKETPVIVGVVNEENRNTTYSLLVMLESNEGITILDSENLTLIDRQTWEKPVNLTAPHNGTDLRVEFLLYRDENLTAPYRECRLWVNATD